nr:MAG TPA: hypothetical protein [Caudoviricetes sp.]
MNQIFAHIFYIIYIIFAQIFHFYPHFLIKFYQNLVDLSTIKS